MKNIKKIIISFIFLLSTNASAVVINGPAVSWNPASINANVNDIFSVDIIGTGFTSNVDGGGLNISFNQNVLSVLSVTIDETVWDFGGAGINSGAIDNLSGTVNGVMFNTFSNVTGDFSIATVTFQAVGAGSSLLSLSDYELNPWASNGLVINPDYVDGQVTVSAVPLPGAAWLFLSGGLGFIGLIRRRK